MYTYEVNMLLEGGGLNAFLCHKNKQMTHNLLSSTGPFCYLESKIGIRLSLKSCHIMMRAGSCEKNVPCVTLVSTIQYIRTGMIEKTSCRG